MTDAVVDASIAIKWYVREADSETAQRILLAPVNLHAPGLLRLELANGLWKHWRKQLVSIDQISEAMASLDRTIGYWRAPEALIAAAQKLSFALDHAIYDCIYLALAQELGAPLVTADRRLLAVAPAGMAVTLESYRP